MNRLRYTLVSDGSTDANLLPIINWTLKQVGGVEVANGTRAEFWRLPENPRSLEERIVKAVELYPCKALFIHRDAETEAHASRVGEIRSAVIRAAERNCRLPAVAIVPVRMTEAWLLFSEIAIREAAGNPNGTITLDLPPLNRLESRPDPKTDLRNALRLASELRGRRLKKFNEPQAVRRIVDFLADFSPLRNLSAFQAFEDAIRQMHAKRWAAGLYPTPA
jgi:hypothetical protein